MTTRHWSAALGLWAALGAAGAALGTAAPEALTQTVQVRAPSGRPLQVRRVACAAPGRADLAATLTLEESGPLTFQVVQLATNEEGAQVLAQGRSLPQIQPHYQRYVVQGQPLGRLTFGALLGAWRLFGLKFSWEKDTYRCTLW
ncbi:hypothetical protein [Deinococcus multiflagellatus]|uniref:Uncharacterized protein n=1 Tax=Deinococcus multiflagellatus TaxID=1656887 RepID=A0ABW1ZKW5_9DEIO|nr:hypothetical protein [Deinococcus multiflagellatus]MBZ9714815.1 hypothetical protein [Deinococcus multiflagellatus]